MTQMEGAIAGKLPNGLAANDAPEVHAATQLPALA